MKDHGPIVQSLDEIVARYLVDFAPAEELELEWFARQRTLSDAVRLAGRAERPYGKRFNHQRRIPKVALTEAARLLLSELESIERVRSFHELFRLVQRTIGEIPGIGELTVYDTALRIGSKLGVLPQKVYLHAGTRDGARYLGFGGERTSLELHELPLALGALRPDQVEDVLCIYKAHLKVLGNAT